jgi:hypothetical protein
MARPEDLAHPPDAQQFLNDIVPDPLADQR